MNHHDDNNETVTPLPRIGDPAPKFEAISTHGPVKSDDYLGKWLILFSHPADFTPVCTTEFIAFQKIQNDLKALNCELLGLSIDSLFSHIAWVRNIEAHFNEKIGFPVIADINSEVAKAYGMIMPGDGDTSTSRCVFIIDDAQIIRAMIYYPLTTGRNTDEIVRVLNALQSARANEVGTPANWQPGDNLILYPPYTQEQAEERVNDKTVRCRDWYFCETGPADSDLQ